MAKNALGLELVPVELEVSCGDCVFFRTNATLNSPCSKLGLLPSSEPCKRFTPDVDKLDVHGGLGKILRKFLPTLKKHDLAIMAAMFHFERRTRKLGFSCGQRVYLSIGDGSYLDQWVKARVVTASKNMVFLRGRSGFKAGVSGSRIHTEEEFDKIKERLVKKGKLSDPRNSQKAISKLKYSDGYEPPTIDSAFAAKKNKTPLSRGSVRIRG